MIKKVKTEQLRPGIFIHDFGEKWLNHPFITNSKRLATQWHIDRIIEYNIKEIYIDTNRGLDVISEPIPLDEWSESFENKKARDKLLFKRREWAPIEKEMGKALEIRNKAQYFIKELTEDIKMGRDFNQGAAVEIVDEMFESLTRNKDALFSLISIQNKDEYTFNHSLNVAVITATFCKYLGMNEEEIKIYTLGALFHDLGKIKIPTEVITKPGAFSREDVQIMRRHPEFGKKLIEEQTDVDSRIIDVVYEHHERMDGSGYPRGLNNEEISLGGRLVSIADVYDALTSDRPYHEGDSPKEVLSYMYKLSPSDFDSDLLQKFIQSIGIYPVGSLVRLKSGFLAIVVESAKDELTKPVVLLIYDSKRKRNIKPRKLDLSAPGASLHQISGTESAAKWDIDVVAYLQGKYLEDENRAETQNK